MMKRRVSKDESMQNRMMKQRVSKDESWFMKKVQGFQGNRRRKRNTSHAASSMKHMASALISKATALMLKFWQNESSSHPSFKITSGSTSGIWYVFITTLRYSHICCLGWKSCWFFWTSSTYIGATKCNLAQWPAFLHWWYTFQFFSHHLPCCLCNLFSSFGALWWHVPCSGIFTCKK